MNMARTVELVFEACRVFWWKVATCILASQSWITNSNPNCNSTLIRYILYVAVTLFEAMYVLLLM